MTRLLLLLALAGCGGGGDSVDCRFKPHGADSLEQAQWVEMCSYTPPVD